MGSVFYLGGISVLAIVFKTRSLPGDGGEGGLLVLINGDIRVPSIEEDYVHLWCSSF